MTYSLRIVRNDTMDSAGHNTCTDLEAKRRVGLSDALVRDARWACRRYDTTARIYNEQGSLVLMVDRDGHRAP
jgi:hypothetical protein